MSPQRRATRTNKLAIVLDTSRRHATFEASALWAVNCLLSHGFEQQAADEAKVSVNPKW